MAYINQQEKKEIAVKVKPILKKYGLKGTLSIDNHSTLNLTIKSGQIDFKGNYNNESNKDRDKEPYSIEFQIFHQVYLIPRKSEFHISKYFTNRARKCLIELASAMNEGNHDNTDTQTDYFDIGWYSGIYLGSSYDKPYQLIKGSE